MQFYLGEQIVGAGDSAGANLLLTTTLKCVQMGIPTPKGLFLAYAPTAIQFIPSPARLLCVMDPLLTFGFLMRCLKGNFIFYKKRNKHKFRAFSQLTPIRILKLKKNLLVIIHQTLKVLKKLVNLI